MPRPLPNFEGFVGQQRLCRYTERLIKGFHKTGDVLPPLLLLAPTGHGKSALARAIASALGTEMHTVFASDGIHPRELYSRLRGMKFADTLFIDEAHSLGRDAQQALFTAVDQRMIPAVAENGRSSGTMESIAEVNLVFASNYPGQIYKALRNRTIELQFSRYTVAELKAIAQRIASQDGIALSPQSAREIAMRAQGAPRKVYQRLHALSLFTSGATAYTLSMVRDYFHHEGIDENGLTPVQRKYLQILAAMANQRGNLSHIAARLGIDTRYVREECDYWLTEQGYIEVLPNSARRLTADGRELMDKRIEEVST